MRKTKILVCVTGAEYGGAQTNIGEILAGLSTQFEFHIACGRPGPLVQEARQLGVEVHMLEHLAWGISPQHDARALREMRDLVGRLQPHVLHSHTSKAGIYARLLGRQAHIPVVHTAHGWSFTQGASAERRLSSWLLERAFQPLTTALICVCHHDRGSAVHRLGYAVSRVRVIYPGIADVSETSTAREAAPHLCEDGAFHVVCVARFSTQKDQPTLLCALAQLQQEGVRATFAGDGKTLPASRALADALGLHDSVHFAGAIDHRSVAALLASANLAVLTTHFEGLPIALIEAHRHGLPAVASGVGGVPEIINDDTGILTPARDSNAVADAIRRLRNDAAMHHRMGMNARSAYLARFGRDTMCNAHMHLYQELAGC